MGEENEAEIDVKGDEMVKKKMGWGGERIKIRRDGETKKTGWDGETKKIRFWRLRRRVKVLFFFFLIWLTVRF